MYHTDKEDVKKNYDSYVDSHDPGHGTHIAGLILKDTCANVVLYSCKYFDPKNKGNDNMKRTINCFNIASTMNLDAIVYAGGGTDSNDEERAAIKKLDAAGVVIFVAAGNEHSDLSVAPYYPASYGFPNMVIVGNLYKDEPNDIVKIAHSSNRNMAGMAFQNGTGVKSTLPHNTTGPMTGTSQATAIMANKFLKFRCKELR